MRQLANARAGFQQRQFTPIDHVNIGLHKINVKECTPNETNHHHSVLWENVRLKKNACQREGDAVTLYGSERALRDDDPQVFDALWQRRIEKKRKPRPCVCGGVIAILQPSTK